MLCSIRAANYAFLTIPSRVLSLYLKLRNFHPKLIQASESRAHRL